MLRVILGFSDQGGFWNSITVAIIVLPLGFKCPETGSGSWSGSGSGGAGMINCTGRIN